MASLDNIIDQIKQESQNVVANVLDEAKKFVADVESDYNKKIDEEIKKINNRCEVELKSISDRSISSGELKKKQLSLLGKQEIINDTIEKAKQKIISLPDKEYIEFLKKVFSKNIPTSDCKIIFNEKDKKRIPKEVLDEFVKMAKEKGSNLTISDEVAKIGSGFLLDFGDIEGNCSFESLIDQNIESLIDKVNNILFS